MCPTVFKLTRTINIQFCVATEACLILVTVSIETIRNTCIVISVDLSGLYLELEIRCFHHVF